MSRASRAVLFLAWEHRPAVDVRPQRWEPTGRGGATVHYEDNTRKRFSRAEIEATEEHLNEQDERVSALGVSVDESRHPWLTAEALMWRPPIPPEYQKRYTWGDLKQLYDRRERIGRKSQIGQHEWYKLCEELWVGSYSVMGFTAKPSDLRILQMLEGLPRFGLLAWKEELWYQALAWEYRQWKEHIMDKMKPLERVNLAFVEAVLEVLPASRPCPPKRTGLGTGVYSQEVDVLWRWLLLHGRHLSGGELWHLAECFATVEWRE